MITRHTACVTPDADTVLLKDLCGIRMLDGHGEMVLESPGTADDDTFIVVLRLDNALYWFQEDPNDGYRSALNTIKRLHSWPQDMPPSSFVAFDPIMVTLRIRTDAGPDGTRQDEVLYGLDERTGLVLFEVGTENIDDYYPSFVHRWSPKGIEPRWLAAAGGTPRPPLGTQRHS